MKKLSIGIVDYGVGNHESVRHTLRELGMRCRTSDQSAVLDGCDLLILPGVGAFKPAIEALRARGLDNYLHEQVARGRPLLGICLGMQLLAAGSHENGFTSGLAMIPGEVRQMPAPHWHIGWNTVELSKPDELFAGAHGRSFFFNHSYALGEPQPFAVCHSTAAVPFPVAVRRDKVAGVQFHPEKSQQAGRDLLSAVCRGLCDA